MKNEFINHRQMIKNLKNPSLDVWYKVYYGNKGKRKTSMKKAKKEKVTLAQLAEEMRNGFKQVNERMDRIERRLDYNNLKKLPN